MDRDEIELYLVTSLYDEGMSESSFRVVRAESELAIAAHMLACPHQWQHFLENARPRDWQHPDRNLGTLWDCVQQPSMTAERLLELIGMTSVDGDSAAQLTIFPVRVDSLATVNADPWR